MTIRKAFLAFAATLAIILATFMGFIVGIYANFAHGDFQIRTLSLLVAALASGALVGIYMLKQLTGRPVRVLSSFGLLPLSALACGYLFELFPLPEWIKLLAVLLVLILSGAILRNAILKSRA